jgi:hypothetical protein
MGKKLGLLLVIAVMASSIIGCSSGSAAVDFPPGVKESQWRSLGPDLGMVIKGVEAGRTVRTVGYFMHKVDGKWVPLQVQNPASVVPAD